MEDLAKKYLEVEREFIQKKEELSSLKKALVFEAIRRGERQMNLDKVCVEMVETLRNDFRAAVLTHQIDMEPFVIKKHFWKVRTPQSPSSLTSPDSEDK